MPIGPAGRATGVNSAGFAIASGSQNPDAACAFVKFATGEVGQLELARIGFAVPIGESVVDSDAYLHQTADIDNQLFIDALAYARPNGR